MPGPFRAFRAAALVSVAFADFGCSSPEAEPDDGAETGGTGAGGSALGGAAGASAGAGGRPQGGAGAGFGGKAGASTGGATTGGSAGTTGASGTSGSSGAGGGVAGMPNGGAGPGGAGAAGAAGRGTTAGSGPGGSAGAGGRGGAGGNGGAGGAIGRGGAGAGGKGGSGGALNCSSRTGGALIDFRACNQTMRFWITNGTFITEAVRLRGNGQTSIACFRPQDGRDCDPALTYHAVPDNPYWTNFELETYFTCPQDVENDKSFWLEQVGLFCGQMTSVTAVDDNR